MKSKKKEKCKFERSKSERADHNKIPTKLKKIKEAKEIK